VLFGLTLTGLTLTDPVLGAHPDRLFVTAAALVISSHAPDFDAIVRLKGEGAYVRLHRGITHSLPALALWPILVMLPYLALFGAGPEAFHLYAWSFAAVSFHVLLDALNGYGVQCLRPFTKRWIHLDVLTICDPFLFVLHSVGLILWGSGAAEAAPLFPLLYAATFLYIGLRLWRHRRRVKRLRLALGIQESACDVTPCLHWWHWSFVAELPDCYMSGFIRHGRIEDIVIIAKGEPTEGHPLIEASKATDGVRAFLAFAQRVHVAITESEDGYVVRWSEMRFHFGQRLPFGAEVKIDRNYGIVSERIGWQKKAWEGPYV
jgi:inner membrane protein